MSQINTAPPIPELENFIWFVENRLAPRGQTKISLEDAVKAYRVYGSELERLQYEAQPALESLDRGEGHVADFDEMRLRLEQKILQAEKLECRSSS